MMLDVRADAPAVLVGKRSLLPYTYEGPRTTEYGCSIPYRRHTYSRWPQCIHSATSPLPIDRSDGSLAGARTQYDRTAAARVGRQVGALLSTPTPTDRCTVNRQCGPRDRSRSRLLAQVSAAQLVVLRERAIALPPHRTASGTAAACDYLPILACERANRLQADHGTHHSAPRCHWRWAARVSGPLASWALGVIV
jgi:hypothetical protein